MQKIAGQNNGGTCVSIFSINMNKYLITKSVQDILKEAESSESTGLKRTLGPWNIIALGIGAIIGAGIFVITGSAAAQFAGPALAISFIIAAICCCFAGLCYSEFASFIPIAGSAYTYGYASLGEIIAWIIGWNIILEYSFTAAAVASGWSGYLVSMLEDFGINLPPQITDLAIRLGEGFETTDTAEDMTAVIAQKLKRKGAAV